MLTFQSLVSSSLVSLKSICFQLAHWNAAREFARIAGEADRRAHTSDSDDDELASYDKLQETCKYGAANSWTRSFALKPSHIALSMGS